MQNVTELSNNVESVATDSIHLKASDVNKLASKSNLKLAEVDKHLVNVRAQTDKRVE